MNDWSACSRRHNSSAPLVVGRSVDSWDVVVSVQRARRFVCAAFAGSSHVGHSHLSLPTLCCPHLSESEPRRISMYIADSPCKRNESVSCCRIQSISAHSVSFHHAQDRSPGRLNAARKDTREKKCKFPNTDSLCQPSNRLNNSLAKLRQLDLAADQRHDLASSIWATGQTNSFLTSARELNRRIAGRNLIDIVRWPGTKESAGASDWPLSQRRC